MSISKERLQKLAGLLLEQHETNQHSNMEEMITDLVNEAMHLVDQSAEANEPGIYAGAELLKDKIMLILWNNS